MKPVLQPLSEFSIEARRKVRVVLSDIDDTLTENGRLPAKAYAALERLKLAGFIVAPITGRPAGWCDLIARQWPVDGVVGENGAFYFRYDNATRKLTRRYVKTLESRRSDAVRLEEIRAAVLAEVTGAAVAADQAYREADLAIDFCEDVPRLPKRDISRIAAVFERFGATAKISSIHVNGWFGGYVSFPPHASFSLNASVSTLIETKIPSFSLAIVRTTLRCSSSFRQVSASRMCASFWAKSRRPQPTWRPAARRMALPNSPMRLLPRETRRALRHEHRPA